MEFLPVEKDGSDVYAGFWSRFGAIWVDVFVLAPFMVALYFLQSISIPVAIISTVVSNILFWAYTIYFHYRYGATLGKMATGIKVTLPNGSPIGLKQAFLRSSVDLGFAALTLAATVVAIFHADPEQYLSAGWMARARYVSSLFPA